MSSKKITIEAERVRFFSAHDEAAFFEWLDKISSICGVEGRGFSIYITVNYDNTTEEDLRELLALFWRYGISMGQLIAFDKLEFSAWFHDKRAYWFSHIFGELQQDK